MFTSTSVEDGTAIECNARKSMYECMWARKRELGGTRETARILDYLRFVRTASPLAQHCRCRSSKSWSTSLAQWASNHSLRRGGARRAARSTRSRWGPLARTHAAAPPPSGRTACADPRDRTPSKCPRHPWTAVRLSRMACMYYRLLVPIEHWVII